MLENVFHVYLMRGFLKYTENLSWWIFEPPSKKDSQYSLFGTIFWPVLHTYFCDILIKSRLKRVSIVGTDFFSIVSLYYTLSDTLTLWQYRLWSFQTGGTKLERFLPKNQHTQRKFLNFENWTNGEVSKSAKSPNLPTFKVNFLYQKLSESFSIFFSLKNINLGAHFLLLTFFDSINF